MLNPDLWQELVRLKRRTGRVEFRHVKGHGSNPHNRAVDKLAREAADLARESVRAAPMVARRRSARQTEPGAVSIEGQVETIRIISVREIRGQPHHAYKYEVVGEDSPHAGAVDDVFARDGEFALRRNHEYEVRFGPAGEGRSVDRPPRSRRHVPAPCSADRGSVGEVFSVPSDAVWPRRGGGRSTDPAGI